MEKPIEEKEVRRQDSRAIRIEFTEEKPQRSIIVEGFPGFGFVSTIATEYIIKHLNAKPIGRIVSDKLMPIAAVHKNEVIYPLEIFYDKKTNIIIVQAVTPVEGLEWRLADAIIDLAKEINAKEIVGLEGVASAEEIKNANVFFYSNKKEKRKSLIEAKIKPLQEGIIIGVTGALLMKAQDVSFSCFFVETHTGLPDNKAAAKLIQALDKYLGLTIDYKPLLEKAKEVEEKLKGLLMRLGEAKTMKEKKKLSYMG
ncbi:MAG: proteasome assembly chaperone family protein [Candidatus Pacearchaeota archaeon]|nr:MAG: proteasome assembly chaperone family protein [Candidatus Pacearchaeota archaeon]